MTAIYTLGAIALLVAADQAVKLWAIKALQGSASIVLIPGLLKLTYVENYGAAFGMMRGMRWVLIGLTAAILGGMIYCLITGRILGKLPNIAFTMIAAGGSGNLLDRIRLGYVVDYLDVNDLFSYPMFNIADCCVVCGAILVIVYVLFLDGKDQEIIRFKR